MKPLTPPVHGGTVIPHGEPKHDKPFTRPVHGPLPFSAGRETAAYARTLLGIREVPPGSNRGPAVARIQASTGAFGEPWCVSTVQDICLQVDGHTIADRTAGAYYLRDYAKRNGWTVPKPRVGCFVVYDEGQGHAGTCVTVYHDGTFDAVEGNYNDAVELVHRNPKVDRCTFIVPPWQR